MFPPINLEEFVVLTLLTIKKYIFERGIDTTSIVKNKSLYKKICVKGCNGNFISNNTINQCRKNKGAND